MFITFFLLILIFAYIAYKSPLVAISGLLCLYGIEQWYQTVDYLFINNSALINLSVLSILLWALLVRWFKGDIHLLKYTKIEMLVIMLFIYSYISTVWTPESVSVNTLWGKAIPYIIAHLLIAPLLISRTTEIPKLFFWVIVIGSTFTVLLIGFADWQHRRIVFLGGGEGNPLTVAQMAGYTAICTIFLKIKDRSILLFIIRWLVVLTAIMLIIKTGSRGQLIGFILSVFLVWPMVNPIKKLSHYFGAAIICCIFAFVVMLGMDQFWSDSARWSAEELTDSYSGRLSAGFRLLEFWISNPIAILLGLGNSASYSENIIGIYPHFVPLEILGEEGLIGGFLYFLILKAWYKSAKSGLTSFDNNKDLKRYLAIFISMSIYSFLLTLKQGSLILNSEFFMLIILISRLNYISTLERKRHAQ